MFRHSMILFACFILLFSALVAALGEKQIVTFPEHTDFTIQEQQPLLTQSNDFIIASSHHRHDRHTPVIIVDPKDDIAIHIAVYTFAEDIEKVTGVKPSVVNATRFSRLAKSDVKSIIVGSVTSGLISAVSGSQEVRNTLKGQWESFDIRVTEQPIKGVSEALVIVGSDRRGTIYALYTLSAQFGVSPFHYFADSPIPHHPTIAFPKHATLSHGPPTVKYRGLFINDEHPALWGWAQTHFKKNYWEPALQVEFYEKWFEMVLRLKGNYCWPAMYISMFGVDGLPDYPNLPEDPIAGPNAVLANNMGVVMGTSHHEPMDRNKPEWDHIGKGPWDWTNKDVLTKHWKYGAERAKGREVLFTMGMRGDGDEPLSGASIELVQNITAAQLEILSEVYGEEAVPGIPKMWAMYKEVADYYADGLKVPDDVTILFSDDNWGNLMSIMPPDKPHPAGAGIYYHVDSWEQMSLAVEYNTTEIWILNIGSLKPLELPTEHFMSLAYDYQAWPRNSIARFTKAWASREFGAENGEEVGDILERYSVYAARSKPELYNSTMFSLVNYDEADRITSDWRHLTVRAQAVYDRLPHKTRPAFYQSVLMLCEMQENIIKLYVAAGRSNLYASQGLNAANAQAHLALHHFHRDPNLTETFHSLNDRKWDHMLDQTHINWKDRLEPDRDTLPPISFVNPRTPYRVGIPVPELTIPRETTLRVVVENSYGSWPGQNIWNCKSSYKCPDPTLLRMDPYGVQKRWIEVRSGGARRVEWKGETDRDWLIASRSHGHVVMDGSADTRVHLSVDWDKVDCKGEAVCQDEGRFTIRGNDGANVTITLPILFPPPPNDIFHGHIQGDGYVVIPATEFDHRHPCSDGANWEILESYGRTGQAVEFMAPRPNLNYSLPTGATAIYPFWLHETSNATVTVQIASTLNFIPTKVLAFGYGIDETDPVEVHPIPTQRLGGVPDPKGVGRKTFVGAVPVDWENTVVTGYRNVTLGVFELVEGFHEFKLFGMTSGVVVEKIWVDLGGIEERGYSYLGPPGSVKV